VSDKSSKFVITATCSGANVKTADLSGTPTISGDIWIADKELTFSPEGVVNNGSCCDLSLISIFIKII
jgi:hypothetical protein